MFALSLSSSGSTSSFLVSFKFFNLTKTYTACTSWFNVLLINNSQDRNTRITVNHKEILMIRRQTDFIVRTRLYLVHHLPFTGETRSWSPDIELGQRPRMDSNFHSNPRNQTLAWITVRLSPALVITWLLDRDSPRHPLPALLMFFVECPPVLSLSPSDVRLRAGPGTADWLLVSPASLRLRLRSETSSKAGAAVTWAAQASSPGPRLLSVRWSVVCCLSPRHSDAYSHPEHRPYSYIKVSNVKSLNAERHITLK